MAPPLVPVTILTGFLGSGKTTLLNHLLMANHGKRFAIIENEFGEVGIDDALLSRRRGSKFGADEEIVEMNNGCICCTVRGDLIRIIKQIIERPSGGKRSLDGIIIETTGLADPAPVAQTFFVNETIARKCKLDGIITVVDAKHILQHLLEVKPEGVENESIEQVAFADCILLNKTNLVTSAELADIQHQLQSINQGVVVVECQQCRVDSALLLKIQSFDLDKILLKEPDFLGNTDHMHDLSVTSVGFRSPEPINVGLLQDWIQEMLETKGADLLRYKGVINVAGMDRKFVFQGVHMLFDGGFTTAWEYDEARETRFVFIGKHLDRELLTQGFLACRAGKLRFKVGDRVLARISSGFELGLVVKVWDQGSPYCIRLEKTQDDVWGSLDDDALMRSTSVAA